MILCFTSPLGVFTVKLPATADPGACPMMAKVLQQIFPNGKVISLMLTCLQDPGLHQWRQQCQQLHQRLVLPWIWHRHRDSHQDTHPGSRPCPEKNHQRAQCSRWGIIARGDTVVKASQGERVRSDRRTAVSQGHCDSQWHLRHQERRVRQWVRGLLLHDLLWWDSHVTLADLAWVKMHGKW